MPARAGFHIHRGRRPAVRRPPVVAGEILARLADGDGPESLATDDRFRTRDLRVKSYDALFAELAATFQSPPRAEWLTLLGAQDVPSGPLNTLDEVFADPQVTS